MIFSGSAVCPVARSIAGAGPVRFFDAYSWNVVKKNPRPVKKPVDITR